MAKFFVGQRVRLTRPMKPENFGLEGRVVQIRPYPKGTVCSNGDVLIIDTDCVIDFSPATYARTAAAFWQLEPIIPDGHRAGVKGGCSLLDELLSREVKSDTLVPLPQQSET